MQFIALNRRLTEAHPESEFEPLIGPETKRASELYAQGTIRQIWSRGDLKGVCALIEADDEETARNIMDTMPIASHGLSEIVVLAPLKPYFGFAND